MKECERSLELCRKYYEKLDRGNYGDISIVKSSSSWAMSMANASTVTMTMVIRVLGIIVMEYYITDSLKCAAKVTTFIDGKWFDDLDKLCDEHDNKIIEEENEKLLKLSKYKSRYPK